MLFCFDLYIEEELQTESRGEVVVQRGSQFQDQNSLLKIFQCPASAAVVAVGREVLSFAVKSVTFNLCLTRQVVVGAATVPSADVDVTPPTLLAVSPKPSVHHRVETSLLT